MSKKAGCKIFQLSVIGAAVVMAALMLVSFTGPAMAKKAEAPKAAVALIDINSASEKELEGIKGIGAATAKKIVANRPYSTVDDLSKAGLKPKAIEAMKPFVTVGKAQAAPVAAAASKASAAVSSKAADAQKAVGGLVDINNATAKELEGIKGVGPATAKKIVAGRPYKSVDELSKAGLSAKAVEAMKPFVTVGKGQAAQATETATKAATKAVAPMAADLTKATKDVKATTASTKAAASKLAPGTKININTADLGTLEKLPEIGPVKAKAIVDGRPYNKIEDIMKVSGIKGKTFDAIKDFIVVK